MTMIFSDGPRRQAGLIVCKLHIMTLIMTKISPKCMGGGGVVGGIEAKDMETLLL